MSDSDTGHVTAGTPDRDAETDKDTPPSAAELEEAGQSALFGAPASESGVDEKKSPAPDIPIDESRTGQRLVKKEENEGDGDGSCAAAGASTPYRVLARKYRPQSFSGLIGQSAMVQTLSNAIKRDRLAHAFLMTGVRGVGKTSTARLIAKSLNCIGPDGKGGPTIDPCGVCEHCVAIAEGRHIDVIEMDAASHTGVDDVREIIEAVRYASVSARYKIYIIDEVHMLSKNAFNALLKTLEEPPAHVKFLFATTEVDKVPITVLSRCQRFDLKRIPAEMLVEHFASICTEEAVDADQDALAMIARAADGSVRDGLSVLDQAIAHADMALDEQGGDGDRPHISAVAVRAMLGLSDRTVVRELLGHVLRGEDQAMLTLLDQQHDLGVEPLAQLRSLMDMVHAITLAKIDGSSAGSNGLSREEQAMLSDLASQMSHGTLHRLWQMLLKAHGEIAEAPDPREAMDMAMLRLVYAASLPDPGAVAKAVEQGGGSAEQAAPGTSAPATGPAASAAQSGQIPVAEPTSSEPEAPNEAAESAMLDLGFVDIIQGLDRQGDLRLAQILHDQLRLVHYAPGRIFYQLAREVGPAFDAELRDALLRLTGQRWQVEKGEGNAQPSIREQELAAAEARKASILQTPLVQAALEAFPDAELKQNGEDNSGDNSGSGARPDRSLRA
ncbi:MAG: DNA polymerase III subunit gamma/tau [Pseudomonadota bacterium]